MANDNEPFLTRAWAAFKAWEDALDYSASDYVLARLHSLEQDVQSLRAERVQKASRPAQGKN